MRKALVAILRTKPVLGLAMGLTCALSLGLTMAEEAKPSSPPPKPPKPRFVPNPELPRLSDGQLRVIPPPPIPAAGDAPMAPEPPGKAAESPKPSESAASVPTSTPAPAPEMAKAVTSSSSSEGTKPAPTPKPATPTKAKPKAKPAPAATRKAPPEPTSAETPKKKGFLADWFAPKPASVDDKAAPAKTTPPRKADSKLPAPATAAKTQTSASSRAKTEAAAPAKKPTAVAQYVAVVTAAEGAFLYRFPESGMISQRLSPGEMIEVLETGEARHRVRTSRGAEGYLKVEALRKASRTEARRFGSGR